MCRRGIGCRDIVSGFTRLGLLVLLACPWPALRTAAADLALDPVPAAVEAHDLVEFAVRVDPQPGANPFTDAQVEAVVSGPTGAPRTIPGFCDADDGSRFRVRYMPAVPGLHRFQVRLTRGGATESAQGQFEVVPSKRRGPLRVDRDSPWHFRFDGTGEHFFWNATTCYWLLGWRDDATIEAILDRFARLKVNRIRVALCGRTTDGTRWDEPMVVNTSEFQFRLNPWKAQRPDSVENPGFDVTRYNLDLWRKCDRLMRAARDRQIIVSLIFYVDGRDPGVDPFGKDRMGCDDEKRYYRYVVARYAAFANVEWDVTNEYHLFRDEAWVEAMGRVIRQSDPYGHLISVHGKGDFPFRQADWVDFAMYQQWDESGGHGFLLKQRRLQAETGRPMPQINEEYGYEDHYPTRWGGGRKAPARNADNRRRLAWGMCMAGGYQTTGERADQGTGKGPDSGGGWLNGRGDDRMVLLDGHAHLVACFTSLPFWRMEPRDDLVSPGAYCLAEPGQNYLVYLPRPVRVGVQLPDAQVFQARWFQPRTGQWLPIGEARGPRWEAPAPPDPGDWALVLTAGK